MNCLGLGHKETSVKTHKTPDLILLSLAILKLTFDTHHSF